jgi:solute carrier family 35 protein C2
MKIKKMREEARMNAHLQNQEDYAPVNLVDPDRDRRGSVAQPLTGARGVRSSLQLAPGVSGSGVDSSRASPVKRLEDLD